MIVVDTTVLVYATGTEHPLREPCRSLAAALTDGRAHATTSIEVIQEFAHVRARRRGRREAVALAHDYAELLAPLMVLDSDQLGRGLGLFETVDALGAFDAVLAAAAMEIPDAVLVSADRGFSRVPGLTHVMPDAAGVQGLLAG